METLQWNSEYSVGVNEMDEQHITLFARFNDLCAALEERRPAEQTGPLLCALLEETRQHFRAEEALLDSAAFPGLGSHADHHKDLNTLMTEYLVRFERGDLGNSANLLSFLRHWLTRHIQIEDKPYGLWLNARGIH